MLVAAVIGFNGYKPCNSILQPPACYWRLLQWHFLKESGAAGDKAAALIPKTVATVQAASAAAQRCVEVPFDVDLQKAWKQSCFNHLFERFGKPLIIILGQKNNPPIVERL